MPNSLTNPFTFFQNHYFIIFKFHSSLFTSCTIIQFQNQILSPTSTIHSETKFWVVWYWRANNRLVKGMKLSNYQNWLLCWMWKAIKNLINVFTFHCFIIFPWTYSSFPSHLPIHITFIQISSWFILFLLPLILIAIISWIKIMFQCWIVTHSNISFKLTVKLCFLQMSQFFWLSLPT